MGEGSFFKPEVVFLLVELQGPGAIRAMVRHCHPQGRSRPALAEGSLYRLLRLKQQRTAEPLGPTA